MSIALVQSQKGAANASSVTATFGAGATAGNTLVAWGYTNSGTNTLAISGWTSQLSFAYSGTGQLLTIFTAIAAGGETGITMTGGNTISRLHIAEFSGMPASVTTDGSNSNTGTSVTTLGTNSVTTTQANDLVLTIAGTSTGEAGTRSWDSLINVMADDAASPRLLSGYGIGGSIGTYSSNATIGTTATNTGAGILVLKGLTTGAVTRITQGLSGSFNAGYAVDDLIVILAANFSGSTIPSTPAGYTQLTSAQQSADNNAMAIFYKKATSTSETYPTITNATDSIYAIYRGQNKTTPFVQTGGQSSAAGGATTISWSGIASFQNAGNDWVITFGTSSVNGGNLPSHPPTNQGLVQNSSNFLAIFDSNGAVSSYSFNSKTLDASSVWMTKTTELQLGASAPVGKDMGPLNNTFGAFIFQAVNRGSTF